MATGIRKTIYIIAIIFQEKIEDTNGVGLSEAENQWTGNAMVKRNIFKYCV